jgi:NAD(P)-dependent dehydrogenase (short-subunit alcohol dehydrogenase family)
MNGYSFIQKEWCTMSWTADDIPNLDGKVAVVTGGNGGLGFESSRALAGAGAHLVMAARNGEKASAARERIMSEHPRAIVDIVQLDLASLESVRGAAEAISSRHDAVDILMNNAGVMAMPERRTEDGFEMQFGVNHLGHWTLTARLLGQLLAADAARVVTVTSTAHHFGFPVDPENPNMEGSYDSWRAYGRSKLANYHFAIGLQREFASRGLPARSLVAHPGFSNTNLQANTVHHGGGGPLGPFFHRLVERVGMHPYRGALSQLRAATDPAAPGGAMYGPRFVNWGPPVRLPILRPGLDDAISTLWDVSEELTGERLDFDSVRAQP